MGKYSEGGLGSVLTELDVSDPLNTAIEEITLPKIEHITNYVYKNRNRNKL
ncbi:MAG: hypothetical protein ACK5NF_02950 [Bacilli bacterium]